MPMRATRFATLLLDWYAVNARDLPWRKLRSPYRIWVSEVMLQQTRVEAVIPYYERWMKRFPSLKALAAARERSVLANWEGLGYYARARNLHRAARLVVREMSGRVPSDPEAVRRLPGVGAYIAAAVASMAFGLDVVAFDANVRRVLARVLCLRQPPDSVEGQSSLRLFAERNLPAGRAGDFNQALMDLGSLICTPHAPRCVVCPLVDRCGAHQLNLQDRIPVRVNPGPRPHLLARAAVIVRRNRVFLVRRSSNGLLGGMWEFPKSTHARRLPSHAAMLRELQAQPVGATSVRLLSLEAMTIVHHTYSHFSVTVHAFLYTASLSARHPDTQWVAVDRLSGYPMGKVDRTIARDLPAALALSPGPRRGADVVVTRNGR